MARQLESWVAFYKDSSSYRGSTESEFMELPSFGLQTILLLYDDGTKQALSGNDFTFFIDGVIGSTNDASAILRRIPGVKFGEWIRSEVYEKIQQEVQRIGQEHHSKYFK